MMWGWTMGTEAWIWMAAWALVMVLVVWLLVRETGHEAPPDPRAILRARFARGEISEEELRRAMRALDDGRLDSHEGGSGRVAGADPAPPREARRASFLDRLLGRE